MNFSRYQDLGRQYNLRLLPKILINIDGVVLNYEGEPEADQLFQFIDRKYAELPENISFEEDTQLVASNVIVSALLISDNKEIIKQYKEVVLQLNWKYGFYLTNEEFGRKFFNYSKENQTILIFRPFGLSTLIYPFPFQKEKFLSFLNTAQLFPILKYSKSSVYQSLEMTWKKRILFVLFRHEKDSKEYDSIFQAFHDKIIDTKYLFVTSTLNTNEEKYFARSLMIKEKKLPSLLIATKKKAQILRYKHTGKISLESLLEFFGKWKNNKINPIFRSERIPKLNSEPVYKLVGKTFNKIMSEKNTADFVVLWTAKACFHCSEIKNWLTRLAEMHSEDPTLLFGVIDATLNEVEGLIVNEIPTLLFFPATNRTNTTELPWSSFDQIETAIDYIHKAPSILQNSVKFFSSDCRKIKIVFT